MKEDSKVTGDEIKETGTRTRKGNRSRNSKGSKSKNFNPKKGESSAPKTPFDDIQVIKDMAQFPMSMPLGTQFDTGANGNTSTASIPGIMKLFVFEGRYTTGMDDPLNIAARNLYAFVTHANSRNASYEANDLMLYVLGVTNLYAIWNHCLRAYGVAKSYSAMNRYLPETLLQAMGFNPSSILSNLNDFRGGLNLIASKASTLVIPSAFAYTSESFSLYSNVYADGENSRSQIYVHVPYNYYLYDETTYETGGALVFNKLNTTTLRTTNEWLTLLNQMLDALLASGSVNIMAADIIKAFGDNLWGITPVPEDYTVWPVYDDEVLESIMNTSLVPVATSTAGQWDIQQVIPTQANRAPSLSQALLTNVNSNISQLMDHRAILNTCYEGLTPAQVVYRTKFKPAIEKFNDTTAFVLARTHFVTGAVIYWAPFGSVGVNYLDVFEDIDLDAKTTLAMLSNFHHAPLITVEDATTDREYIHGDVENITFITSSDLKKLNEVVVQVLFNVATVYPIK